jgi:SNF2 family DNA or RNA helicase
VASGLQKQFLSHISDQEETIHNKLQAAERDTKEYLFETIRSFAGKEEEIKTDWKGRTRSSRQFLSVVLSYLIFCQMKEMLDILQNDVLRKLLPSVQFLRLDGSVEATKRQNIVNEFNTDPSYDCLLLTTSVGGLGLNLTGADTVIFVEHDWNPQKDIQAMDRAHRIGQRKVVNVYRLITRGTLEEKIVSLQEIQGWCCEYGCESAECRVGDYGDGPDS